MISILTNSASLRAQTQLSRATVNINRTLERLATGKRINSAADDPAGSVAVTHLASRQSEIDGTIKGLQSQQFTVDATEGGLSSVTDLLQELNGIVVSAANASALSQGERDALQLQADSILSTIDWLGNTTEFKGARILTGINVGSLGAHTYAPNPAAPATTTTASLADLRSGGKLNLTTGNLAAAQQSVKTALSDLTTRRATAGARSAQIDSQINTLRIELENTASARSAIEDADYAQEVATLSREQTIQQAATYVTQIAGQHRAQTVMELLRSINTR